MTDDGERQISPEQALATLLDRLTEFDAALGEEIQATIDIGRTEAFTETVGRRRSTYEVTRPLTTTQALGVVENSLMAHFVETPTFTNAAIADLSLARPPSERSTRDWAVEVDLVGEGASPIRTVQDAATVVTLTSTPQRDVDEVSEIISSIIAISLGRDQ